MPDELVLSFDTAAAHCAAALLSGDQVLASAQEPMARGQAERLIVLLEEVLEKAGVRWRDLDRIGVGMGPGNFTGIRISIAAARGLALGLRVPAIGVSTLDALAFGRTGPVVTSVEARSGQVYVQASGSAPVLVSLDTLPVLPSGATCIGPAAQAIASACGGRVAEPSVPLAVAIGHLASRADAAGADRPAPLYLRRPDAAPAGPVPSVR